MQQLPHQRQARRHDEEMESLNMDSVVASVCYGSTVKRRLLRNRLYHHMQNATCNRPPTCIDCNSCQNAYSKRRHCRAHQSYHLGRQSCTISRAAKDFQNTPRCTCLRLFRVEHGVRAIYARTGSNSKANHDRPSDIQTHVTDESSNSQGYAAKTRQPWS